MANSMLLDVLSVLECDDEGNPTEEIMMIAEDFFEDDQSMLNDIDEIREDINNEG